MSRVCAIPKTRCRCQQECSWDATLSFIVICWVKLNLSKQLHYPPLFAMGYVLFKSLSNRIAFSLKMPQFLRFYDQFIVNSQVSCHG